MQNEVGALVRKMEQDWISGEVQVSKYVSQNFYEDISTIEAYLNSKHTSGSKDSLGREKPFFNICIAKKNITARATDIDRKNIRAKANKAKDLLASYLYTIHAQKWMNDTNFGLFLNEWGDYLAAFNSAVVKFVENSDGLTSVVMDWNKIICDVVDFKNNPKVEILELTPSQLRKRKGYDQEQVENLIKSATTARELPGRQRKDQKSEYIRLYEVHGELPLSYLTDKEKDEDAYVQQMHVISFVMGKDKKVDDFVLVKGKEKKDPYMLTWLMPSVDGSISLMGSVKLLFDAQWMVNHNAFTIKNHLDLSSKIFLQTSDPQFVTQNLIKNLEDGKIFVWDKNNPNGALTKVNNQSNDMPALKLYGDQWKALAQELTSTPDILQGANMPSGTAFRQAAIIQQEAHSNFGVMTENKGLHIEVMFREFITPYLLKKMDTTEEITATLDAYGIDKIDKMFVASKAVERFNRKAVEAVINRTQLPDLAQEQQNVQQELQNATQRFIKPSDIPSKTWKEVIGDFEGDVVYEITDENTDKQATFETLSNLLQTIATNPMVLQDPNAKLIFNKILEETGRISPVELQNTPVAPMVGGPTAGMNNNQSIIK